MPRLVVSEMFFSIQGEGKSCGVPALFLRLAACNLQCSGFSYQAPETGEPLGCDTKLVWRKGEPYSYEKIFETWQSHGWLEKIKQGAHLVITGGEPLLQQEKLISFIQQLDQQCERPVFIEVETNATIKPNDFLQQRVNQFNVSPKLTHSGETREKAYCKEVLTTFAKFPQACFKFVVQNAADVAEIQCDYQQTFAIENTRIWLMPEGGTKVIMESRLQQIVELCIENNYNFSPRLHIHIWDEATGK